MSYVNDTSLKLYLDAKGYTNPTSTWSDSSGNGNNGTLYNFNYNTTSGWTSNSLILDGGDDRIEIPDGNYADFDSNDFTIQQTLSLAILPLSYSRFSLFQQRVNTTSNHSLSLYYVNTSSIYQFEFRYSADGVVYTSLLFNYNLIINTKYVIQIKKVDTILYLYINNTKYTFGTLSSAIIYNSTAKFYLGTNNNTNGSYNYLLQGNLYNFAVYNRALLDTEMTQNYNDAIAINGTNVTVTSPIVNSSVITISPIISTIGNVLVSSNIINNSIIMPTSLIISVQKNINIASIILLSNNTFVNSPTVNTFRNTTINSNVIAENMGVSNPIVLGVRNINVVSSIIASNVVLSNPIVSMLQNKVITSCVIISLVSLFNPIINKLIFVSGKPYFCNIVKYERNVIIVVKERNIIISKNERIVKIEIINIKGGMRNMAVSGNTIRFVATFPNWMGIASDVDSGSNIIFDVVDSGMRRVFSMVLTEDNHIGVGKYFYDFTVPNLYSDLKISFSGILESSPIKSEYIIKK